MAKAATPRNLMGAIVKDKISGFRGTVTAIVWYLSGSIQAHVSPPVGKDGKMPESWTFDLDRLDFVKAGPVTATPPDDTSSVKLGMTAVDLVTGIEGTLTEKAVYLNGCTHVILTAKTSSKDERILAVDWKRLDMGRSAQVISAPPAVAGTPPMGGPSRRVA